MFTLIFLSFAITYILTPLVIRFANQFNLIDDPSKRDHPAHTHDQPIPRAGGLAILFGISIPLLLFLPMSKALAGIILASIIAVGIGLWDDYHDLSPYLRFGLNLFTAVIVVGVGIGIPYIGAPWGDIIHLDTWRVSFDFFGTHSILVWADIFAIVWIVWMMNIVGWSSGVDGQMPGFVVIACLVLGMLSLKFSAHDISQTTVATLAFITAGAYAGFIPWNFYPQKIMPGYGGKSLAGLLVATIAILSGGKIGSALIILAIPILDAIYTMIRRVSHKKSPFRPDRSHLHHLLLDGGWGKRKIALFYWSVSAILGLITLLLDSRQKFYLFLLSAAIVSGMILWFNVLKHPWMDYKKSKNY
jgi:UDP-GlcNAc:undecaprenyl-phosphate GlcNAc-1-phosphate transferase